MTSQYLERAIRDRLIIARDMAAAGSRDWDVISTIADGFDVLSAAVTVTDGGVAFRHLSNHCWTLTGYWPSELEGKSPALLYAAESDADEAARFWAAMTRNGAAETRIALRHKNGETFGCHALGHVWVSESAPGRTAALVFLSECSLKDCEKSPCSV